MPHVSSHSACSGLFPASPQRGAGYRLCERFVVDKSVSSCVEEALNAATATLRTEGAARSSTNQLTLSAGDDRIALDGAPPPHQASKFVPLQPYRIWCR